MDIQKAMDLINEKKDIICEILSDHGIRHPRYFIEFDWYDKTLNCTVKQDDYDSYITKFFIEFRASDLENENTIRSVIEKTLKSIDNLV